jgi:hypothetical protein
LVAAHTPVRVPQLRVGVRDLQHDRVDRAAGEAVLRRRRLPPGQVYRGPVGHRPVDDRQQGQVDVERISDPPSPDPGTRHAGHLPGPALQHEFARRGVLPRLATGEHVQPQRLPSRRVRLAEGEAVGQVLEIGAIDMHLELIARLRVEPRLGMQAVDVRVHVHHEHGACVAREDIQVVEVELAGLGGQRRIQMMGHGISTPSSSITASVSRVSRLLTASFPASSPA